MLPKNLISKFEDLYKLARVSPSIYRDQSELIELYRQRELPFLATMHMRHRVYCSECGSEIGAAALHFENPKVRNNTDTSNVLFGPTKGIFSQMSSEDLHKIIEHAGKISDDFLQVLNSV